MCDSLILHTFKGTIRCTKRGDMYLVQHKDDSTKVPINHYSGRSHMVLKRIIFEWAAKFIDSMYEMVVLTSAVNPYTCRLTMYMQDREGEVFIYTVNMTRPLKLDMSWKALLIELKLLENDYAV